MKRNQKPIVRWARLALLSALALMALPIGPRCAAAAQNLQPSKPLRAAQEATGSVNSAAVPAGPTAASEAPYLIGADDVLAVSVWHEPDLSRSVSVRPDGKISLPLVGELQAAGKSVLDLQNDIRHGLSNFVKAPEVVVIVAEIRSQRINVIGQVTRAGAFPLTQSMGVIDAIAVAGGLREFAKKDKIYVLRTDASGQRQRMPYKYTDVLRGKGNAKEIVLESRDTVVVP